MCVKITLPPLQKKLILALESFSRVQTNPNFYLNLLFYFYTSKIYWLTHILIIWRPFPSAMKRWRSSNYKKRKIIPRIIDWRSLKRLKGIGNSKASEGVLVKPVISPDKAKSRWGESRRNSLPQNYCYQNNPTPFSFNFPATHPPKNTPIPIPPPPLLPSFDRGEGGRGVFSSEAGKTVSWGALSHNFRLGAGLPIRVWNPTNYIISKYINQNENDCHIDNLTIFDLWLHFYAFNEKWKWKMKIE